VDSKENDDAFRKKDDIRVLKLYPHAVQQANAYYSPDAHGILFGFSADKTGQGRNLPGQCVFTCLSQDIIAHEVTHAVIDGIRTNFPSPPIPTCWPSIKALPISARCSRIFLTRGVDRRIGGRLYQTDLAPVARPISYNLTLCALAAATCICGFRSTRRCGRVGTNGNRV
jgi:hypothetical protein